LRFRIVDITTLNGRKPRRGRRLALARLVGCFNNQPDINRQRNNARVATIPVLGGGLNNTYTVQLPEPNGLAPLVGGVCVSGTCSVDVQFRLGVMQGELTASS
jgi:hypothetical protein